MKSLGSEIIDTKQREPIKESFNDDQVLGRDEIDLFDLFDDLLGNIRWLALGFFSVIAAAVYYLLVSTPTYESMAKIKPASDNKLLALNIPELKGIYQKTVEDAYADVRSTLQSSEVVRAFYQDQEPESWAKSKPALYHEAKSLDQNVARFTRLIELKTYDNQDDERYLEVSFRMNDAEQSASILNRYIDFALERKLLEVINTLESKLAAYLRKLEYDANLLREQYYSEKTKRKLELSEARGIAAAVGQRIPLFSSSEIVGTYEPPLYMMGTKALIAESAALGSRGELAKDLPHGEDHFVEGLPEILFSINQLKSLSIDYSNVELALVDQRPVVPLSPVKPNKKLVIAISLVAGSMLGVLVALFMAAFKRHRFRQKIQS